MTSRSHKTGTDRLAEVAARPEADIIVNVQEGRAVDSTGYDEQAIHPLLNDQMSRLERSNTKLNIPVTCLIRTW